MKRSVVPMLAVVGCLAAWPVDAFALDAAAPAGVCPSPIAGPHCGAGRLTPDPGARLAQLRPFDQCVATCMQGACGSHAGPEGYDAWIKCQQRARPGCVDSCRAR